MQIKFLILFLLFCASACISEKSEKSDGGDIETKQMAFDKTKWRIKEGGDYPFRDQMLMAVVKSDSLRKLNNEEIVETLGQPNRTNEGHLYYTITQTRIGAWTLHAKTMVIKLTDDNSIEWIKIHE